MRSPLKPLPRISDSPGKLKDGMGSPDPQKTAAERSVGILGLLEDRQQCIVLPLKLGYLPTHPQHHPPPSLRDKIYARFLVTSFFSHLSESLRLRRATSLSCSSLLSKDGEAEDLPIPGILAIPSLTSSERLLFSRALTWTPR